MALGTINDHKYFSISKRFPYRRCVVSGEIDFLFKNNADYFNFVAFVVTWIQVCAHRKVKKQSQVDWFLESLLQT